MCDLVLEQREEGRMEGRMEGMLEFASRAVSGNMMSLDFAAKQLGMSVEELESKMAEAGYDIPGKN